MEPVISQHTLSNAEADQRPLAAAASPSSSLGGVPGKYGAQELPPGDTFISSLAAWASTSPASALAFSLVVGCIAYDGVVWLARRRKALRRIKQFIWQAVLPVGCFILPSWLLQNLVSSLASHDGSLILPTSSFCLALVFNTLSEELKTYGVPYISLVLARLIHAIWVVSAIRMALGGLCGLSTDPSIIGLLRFGTLVFASVVVVHLFLEWIHQATIRMADSEWRDEEYLILDFIGELDTSSDRSEDDVEFFADESIQESTSVVDLRDLDFHLSDEDDFFDCSLIKEEISAIGSPFFSPETSILDEVKMPLLVDVFPSPKTRVDDSFEDMKIMEQSSMESIGDSVSMLCRVTHCGLPTLFRRCTFHSSLVASAPQRALDYSRLDSLEADILLLDTDVVDDVLVVLGFLQMTLASASAYEIILIFFLSNAFILHVYKLRRFSGNRRRNNASSFSTYPSIYPLRSSLPPLLASPLSPESSPYTVRKAVITLVLH
ncbi:uncharacterized protein LAESUDRAFT_815227 [Laetiporus sulphureus 93-53]|uniref:Uncharacterized protein n=1 Tax=Laetiporus sulphureus 93-53 TaxID=1314785 RepID=A0A165CD31_9APHY|nr:uncharacterized protein LAESUDRAFT_815227 [Laetiporus sulphureus 93-53]KZT02593.1 hypothetical protein LAESUDRAFT_815227 [Laetiporus sulphureus 93-53]